MSRIMHNELQINIKKTENQGHIQQRAGLCVCKDKQENILSCEWMRLD